MANYKNSAKPKVRDRLLRILEVLKTTDSKNPINLIDLYTDSNDKDWEINKDTISDLRLRNRKENNDYRRQFVTQKQLRGTFNALPADKSAIKDDIEAIKQYANRHGFDIVEHDETYYLDKIDSCAYNRYLGNYFELFELKIIVDAIASLKCLTMEETVNLIDKVLQLASYPVQQLIIDTLSIDEKLKAQKADLSTGEKLDPIFKAIYNGMKRKDSPVMDDGFQEIEFTYRKKQYKEKKSQSSEYIVKPYALVLWDEDYYLIARTIKKDGKEFSDPPMRHFHVAHIDNVKSVEDVNLDIEFPETYIDNVKTRDKKMPDIPKYMRQCLEHYSGDIEEKKNLEFICGDEGIRILRQMFNRSLPDSTNRKGNRTVWQEVYVNHGFYRWLASVGTNIRLDINKVDSSQDRLKVQDIIDNYLAYLNSIQDQYVKHDEEKVCIDVTYTDRGMRKIKQKFGDDVFKNRADSNDCRSVLIEVYVDEDFYGWLASAGTDVQIIPKEGQIGYIEAYTNYLKVICQQYGNEK